MNFYRAAQPIGYRNLANSDLRMFVLKACRGFASFVLSGIVLTIVILGTRPLEQTALQSL